VPARTTPRRSLVASALRVCPRCLHAGERRDFGFPSQTVLDAYTLVNLAAKIAIGERFTLVLRAENLFDEDYELASGYNSMGQSFFGALRYEFR
jgi:outer membrane cobalamin receptor